VQLLDSRLHIDCYFEICLQVSLRTLDDVNVAFTVVSLVIVSILMVASIVSAFVNMDPSKWNGIEKAMNSTKIVSVLLLCGLLLRFVIIQLQEAFSFTLLKDKKLPENKLLGIPICKEETFETRDEYCDEKSFLVRVAIAWATAACLVFFLVFRAAPQDEATIPMIASTSPRLGTGWIKASSKSGALTASIGDKDNNKRPSMDPDTSSTHVMDPSARSISNGGGDNDNDDEDESSGDLSVGEPDDELDTKKQKDDEKDSKRLSYHVVNV